MLTPRQADLLNFIRRYQAERGGVSPSYREMQAALGLKSIACIHRLLALLAERGLIERRARCARAILIVPPPEQRTTIRGAVAAMIEDQGALATAAYLRSLIDDLFPQRSVQ